MRSERAAANGDQERASDDVEKELAETAAGGFTNADEWRNLVGMHSGDIHSGVFFCQGKPMETVATQIAHWATLAGVLALLGMALQQHKVWVRLKDRVNSMWYRHCRDTGEKYIPLENGNGRSH